MSASREPVQHRRRRLSPVAAALRFWMRPMTLSGGPIALILVQMLSIFACNLARRSRGILHSFGGVGPSPLPNVRWDRTVL